MDYLKEKIILGEFKPGEQIPSEPKLAEQFSVSRLTVRSAISELVNEKLLYRRHGLGTFVSKPRVETSELSAISLQQNTLEKGFSIRSTVLSVSETPAEKPLRQILELKQNEKVVILKRLRFINDVKTVLQESFVPRKFIPDYMQFDWQTESLYKVITREGRYKIGSAKESLEAINGPEDVLTCLEAAPRTPVLYSERITMLTDLRPVEFVKSWYRGDKYKFEIEIK